MLSITCKAAIKSVIFLASKSENDHKTGIKEVAKHIGESEHTVGKLLQKLVKDKIICSLKGPNGGFYVTHNQISLPVIKIVNSIDGKNVFKQCVLGTTKCNEAKPCPLHSEYKIIREKFAAICEEKKVCDLYDGVNIGKTFLIK